MQEMIGQVTLDYTYYPGEDLYSDGPVEEELLEIAKNFREEELNQEIARRKSWPVLYHFSHIRQNILEWLPIKKTDRILEIGAGCGAITGALASKGGQVTCIDLSKMRSTINAWRNRESDNIRILVGNFQDIEQNLTERFDYITLIGVFEYSQGYIGTNDPYVEMLRRVSKHLAPGGKLVIAIENRLGLKYWAGCTEDHLGSFFEGLEGYPHPSGVRTFSRSELDRLIHRAGDFHTTFYYPYPDYKFPLKIYSDEKLPGKGELTENFRNFDRPRVQLFEEPKAYDTLVESGLFPEFSNSFLVIARAGEEESRDPSMDAAGSRTQKEEVLYTKYSNERSRRFALRTDIIRSDAETYVKKTALYPEGEEHIQSLPEKERALTSVYAEAGWTCNHGEILSEDPAGAPGSAESPVTRTVRLDFESGETLEQQLDRLLADGEADQAAKKLTEFLETLKKIHDKKPFQKTEEFVRVFGQIPELPGASCAEATNIDLVCQNLICKEDGQPAVLDYEWTFFFPVPCKYLLYRVIHYYLETTDARQALTAEDFYQTFSIPAVEREIYERMERSFQRYLEEGITPMRELYSDMTPGLCPVREAVSGKLQIFYEYDGTYLPEHSCTLPLKNWTIDEVLPVPAGCGTIRLDPCEEPCMVQFDELSFDGNMAALEKGGVPDGGIFGTWGYFAGKDPAIFQIPVPKGARTLHLRARIYPAPPQAVLRAMHKEQQARAQAEKIHAMEHTKIWKLYRRYRDFREGK